MATSNFYLIKPSADESVIKLTSYLNAKLFNYSFGISIPTKYWDTTKQRVKKAHPQSMNINIIIDKIEAKVKELSNRAQVNGELLSADVLRNELNILLGKTEEQQNNIQPLITYLEKFILEAEDKKRPNTIKKYTTLKIHLQNFEKSRNKKLLIKEVDSIYEEFTSYLIKQKLVNQTIGKYIQAYKVFVNDLVFKKIIQPVNLKTWKVERKPGAIIVLTEEELNSIEKLKKLSPKLQRTKSCFLFACYTGLRYSDIMNLKKENIKGKYLNLTTVKTSEHLVIPLSDKALNILNEYDNQLPMISNQKLNDYIKELAQLAGINSDVQVVTYSGAKRKEECFKKYELITFHTARKTCITSLLKKGLPTEILQRIVGIEDYRTLKFYINMNNDKSIYYDFFKLVN